MAKLGRKRYGMSGAGRRNVNCDLTDDMFEKNVTADEDYVCYLEFVEYSHQEDSTERGDSLDHNDGNDNNDDPQYMIFLHNTEQEGTSYVTTIEENGLPLFLHYEKESKSSDEWNDAHRRKVKNTRKGDKVEGKDLANLKGKNIVERPKVLRSDMGNSETSVLEEDEMFEPLNPVSMGRRPISGKKHKYNMQSNLDKEQRTSRTGSEEKYAEEDYAVALQCVQHEGCVLKALFPNNQDVEYDHDDSGDDEVLEINYATFCNGGSFHASVPSVDYCEVGNTCELLYKNEHSQFRQKIINILKRPYDQAEYEKLLQNVKVRKPVERNLELRHGRERTCPSNRIGKSYLDYFKDFNKKLEEVSPDKHKMLNILRGFFFWLQNITQVGAFKPWNDPSCLAVMPGSC